MRNQYREKEENDPVTMQEKLKRFFGVQDMTQGKPMTGLIRFSIPLLIGNLAQQLYNTVDSIIVGQYVGDAALAAVGTSGPILNLLLVLFMGVSTGATILTSQFFGAKDKENLSLVVGNTISLTVLCGVFMMVVGYFASPALIRLVNPPPDVESGAVAYLQILFLGMVGCALYNILSGVLRGMGDSVFPLLYLLLSCLLNIVLDIVFVKNFGLGVAGVAWATIIAQGISGILCLIRLWRMRAVAEVTRRTLRLNGQLTRKLCGLGLPAGVTQAIFSLSAIIVQGLTNSLGTAVIAASVAVMRVDGFAMMPNFTFGTAATTFVGQNVGARQPERVHRGTRDMLVLALSVAAVLVLCILLFGHQLIGMFTSTPEVQEIGQRGLQWLAFGYLCFAVTQVLQGVMRGAGETVAPMWISIINTVIIRLPLAYLMAYLSRSPQWPNGHPDAIFASLLITWIMGMLMSAAVYRMGKWRKRLPEGMQGKM